LWLEDRECFEKYADVQNVWLTKYGNPYASHSVNYHWRKLRDAAGIEVGGRYLPYYSLRHTAGTNIGEQIGAAGAAGQLRQKDQRRRVEHAFWRSDDSLRSDFQELVERRDRLRDKLASILDSSELISEVLTADDDYSRLL
jgi:hypothetical protein